MKKLQSLDNSLFDNFKHNELDEMFSTSVLGGIGLEETGPGVGDPTRWIDGRRDIGTAADGKGVFIPDNQ